MAAFAVPVRAAWRAEGGFDAETFRTWVRLRAGDGAPVFWVSAGTVRAFPSGDLLAFMEGFDAARAHWPEPGRLAHQYNRKIYLFRDPATQALLKGADGRDAEPVAYPYQFITYGLAGDRLETWVEQGAGPRRQRLGPGRNMAVRRVGRTLVYTAPVYLDVALPMGQRLQAFENYDFVVDPERPASDWVLSWVRTGAAPPALGGGPCVMHLVSWRVDRFADLPASLRAYVEERAPLWRAPPRDLAEIRALQAA